MINFSILKRHANSTLIYRADIDGLRGIAVLLVLVFHFELLNIGKAGFIGVDIFFVISGYLISKIIWSGIDAQTFSLSTFYIRRIRRLAPPLIATLILTLGVASVVLLPAELTSLAKEAIASILYVSNVFYWQTLNYFGLQTDSSFLLHTWSLAVEEQFYLFFPILLITMHRFFPARRASPICALVIASFGLNLVMVGIKPEATFYLLPTRAWELLAGSLLAAVEFRLPKEVRYGRTAGIFAIALLIFALAWHHPGVPFPGLFAILPVTSAVLLLYAGSIEKGVFSKGLTLLPLRFIGIISYSLYLVHWPIKTFIPLLVYEYTACWRIFGFFLSFVLAFLMWLFVERPSRSFGGTLTGARVYKNYALWSLSLLVVFGSVLVSGGWNGRHEPEVQQLASATRDKDESTQGCTLADARSLPECHLGKKGEPQSWVILGDSHAQALSGAFSQWLTVRGEAGVLIFQHGCAPVYDMGDNECKIFLKNVRTVWKLPSVKSVFLVSIWRPGMEKGFVDGAGRFVNPENAPAYFSIKFPEMIKDIRNDGKRVYLWLPLPRPKKHVPFGLARSKAFNFEWKLGQSREEYELEYQAILRVMSAESSRVNGMVNPAKVMCGTGTCLTMIDGRPIYHDSNHPAASQENFFAKMLSQQIGDEVD